MRIVPDPAMFPAGSVEFDCALSMRRTAARWRSQPRLELPRHREVA